MKKSIGDIALNVHGSQIAIVENQGGYDSVEESAVRIYNVGRKRNEDNNAVSDVIGNLIKMKFIYFLFFPFRRTKKTTTRTVRRMTASRWAARMRTISTQWKVRVMRGMVTMMGISCRI